MSEKNYDEIAKTMTAMKAEALKGVFIWMDRVTGQPHEETAHWTLEGFHSSQPGEVLDAAAVAALTARVKPIIDAWNQSPADPNAGRYKFYAIRLIRNPSDSATDTNPWTGETNWEAWGDGTGHVLYTID